MNETTKSLDCLIYAYERIKTDFIKPPKNISSSLDSYDTEFGWSKDDYRSAVGDNSRNIVTTRTTEVRAYFPGTRKDEFIVQGKGNLYSLLSDKEDFSFNGQEYQIVNGFITGEIVNQATRMPLVKVIGTILKAKVVPEQSVINEMKKYRRGLR